MKIIKTIFQNKYLLCAFLIVFLASSIRFYQLGKNPPGITLDEAAIGWNAYSILKTGRDEYGQLLPMQFRSLDDYKPPLYIYLAVPSVAIFGMNEFSVRFPAAFFGVLSCVFIILLLRKLFPYNKKIALYGGLFLAINPWSIQFTRTAYETGTTIFFLITALYLLLLGQTKIIFTILSSTLLGLNIYLYQASRVFVPLFVFLVTPILYFKFGYIIKKTIIFLIFFLVFLFPLVLSLTSKEGQIRFKGTSVFQDPAPHEELLNRRITDWLNNDRKSTLLFHLGPLDYSGKIFNNFLLHLRPDFLFMGEYDGKVAHAPGYGLMHVFDLALIPIGLYFLFKKDRLKGLLIIGLVAISIIPASVTLRLPSSIRTTTMVVPLIIASAIGFSHINKKIQFLSIPVVIFFLAYYLHMYFVHLPIERASTWYFGYREMAEFVNKNANKYKNVYISNRLDQPLNFLLFFNNYSPEKYISSDGGRVSGGFSESGNHYSNVYFGTYDLSEIKKKKNSLFVGTASEITEEQGIVLKIYLPGPEKTPWITAKEFQ
jgi:hypothetical protein